MKHMKDFVKGALTDYILLAILFIALGIIFLVFPETSGKLVCYLLASALCLLGLVRSVKYFRRRVAYSEYRLDLVSGIILLGVGVFVFAKPELIMSILPTVIGISVLIDSLVKLQSTVDMLRLHVSSWWLSLIITVVTAVFGIVMVTDPFGTAAMLLRFIGISLIIAGGLDVWSVASLSHQIKKSQRSSAQDGDYIDVDCTDV